MTTLVKIHRKGQMTLPSRLRAAIGVSEGDIVEASLQHGRIVITPKLVIDRSQLPNADKDYTPAQRRAIDRGIAQSEKEYKKGQGIGPFDSHAAFTASLHSEAAKLRVRKTKRAIK